MSMLLSLADGWKADGYPTLNPTLSPTLNPTLVSNPIQMNVSLCTIHNVEKLILSPLQSPTLSPTEDAFVSPDPTLNPTLSPTLNPTLSPTLNVSLPLAVYPLHGVSSANRVISSLELDSPHCLPPCLLFGRVSHSFNLCRLV